jgi:predicted nucleic acid-binding protein
MIILDTNVLSEPMRRDPDGGVLDWLDGLDAVGVGTASVCAAELLYGVALLPEGRRRRDLGASIRQVLEVEFPGRIYPFDVVAAERYCELVAVRERAGRPIHVGDAQVAAVCLSIGASLATRNVVDFEGTGLELINPWTV